MVDLEELISKPRRQASSLSELAPWFGLVADDVVICSDGSLLAGYAFEGSAMEGVDDDALNAQIEMLQRSFRGIGDRITVWSFVDRRFDTQYELGTYTNEVASLIEEAWAGEATKFQHAKLRHEVYLGYRFDSASFAFFDAVRIELDAGDNVFAAIVKVLKRQVTAGGTIAIALEYPSALTKTELASGSEGLNTMLLPSFSPTLAMDGLI